MSQIFNSLGTPMSQELYAQQWKIDAEHISNSGHYHWMSEQLGPQGLVVEIGCGSGSSTLALAKKSKVICIESNKDLVELCRKNLLSNGLSVQVVGLSELITTTSQVMIVNCDVFDISIDAYLESIRPTAIACWLIGAAPETIAKNIEKKLEEFTGSEMAFYRRRVHERAYDLGVKTLAPKGVVHVVDRIGIRSWNEKDVARMAVVEIHSELASMDHYLVEKRDAYLRRTPEGVTRSSISMMSVEKPDGFDSAIEAISSMKSRRRE